MLLLSFRALAQPGPPDLRCLEVLSNGDIKLTWIPPPDPSNQFFAYEVFYAIAATGPFTSASPTLAPLSTSSYTHVGAGGDVQARYYYIACKYGPGGSGGTVYSDTVKSIFLNIFPPSSTPDLKIDYNAMTSPLLPSASPNYTITKEYPAGTWSVFKVTPEVKYTDTISVCSATIFYRVSLDDKSGCTSRSNILGGVYHDSKQPNEPFVDSISVLPNGNTIIAWHVPYDKDIVSYQVQQLNALGNRENLDTVGGRNSTAYTHTTTDANTRPVSLYIGSVDSCKKGSTFNYDLTTMFLKTAYDRCGYKTQLTWNAYQSMPQGVLEYRVYYSVNGAPYTLAGSTQLTSFMHTGASPGQSLSYFVRVINKSKTITSSSNRVTFFSSQVGVPAYVYVIDAGISANRVGVVNVLLDTSAYCRGINIQRSEDGITFTDIGFVPRSSQIGYTYMDEGIEPLKRSYYYRAVVTDSCGNPRLRSNAAKTILLRAAEVKDQPFRRRLAWSPYEGFAGGVSTYQVYRIVNGVTGSLPIATTAAGFTEYTDDIEEEASKGSQLDYLVTAVEGSGNPYGFVAQSNSNTVPVYTEGLLFVPNAFMPEGYNKTWLPVTHFVDKYEYKVRIFDRWGKTVFETSSDTEGWDGGNEPLGVYAYLISYRNSRGEYSEAKGCVTLIR